MQNNIKVIAKEYSIPILNLLALMVFGIKKDLLPSWILNLLPLDKLVPLVLFLLILTIWLSYSLHQSKKLIPRFGVLWNKKEPYCHNCELSLARYKVSLNNKIETGLKCTKCNNNFELIHKGNRMTLEEAQKLL